MINKIIRRLFYGNKADSKAYIEYLRGLGMKIGEETTIYVPTKTQIDTTRPWLISIGNNVKITEDVTILTHGFDWSVLKGVYGDILGSGGGCGNWQQRLYRYEFNNPKGVHIGNNVIIGANSLVNKDIPDNCVAAGNPCKVIMGLEAYHEKRKAAQVAEARELVQLYRERYGREPDEKALHEFFWLFTDGNDELPECWESMMKLGGNYEYTKEQFKKNNKKFKDMDEFLKQI